MMVIRPARACHTPKRGHMTSPFRKVCRGFARDVTNSIPPEVGHLGGQVSCAARRVAVALPQCPTCRYLVGCCGRATIYLRFWEDGVWILSPVLNNVGINTESSASCLALFRPHRYSTSAMQLCPAVPSITIMALPSNMADSNRPLLRKLPRKTFVHCGSSFLIHTYKMLLVVLFCLCVLRAKLKGVVQKITYLSIAFLYFTTFEMTMDAMFLPKHVSTSCTVSIGITWIDLAALGHYE